MTDQKPKILFYRLILVGIAILVTGGIVGMILMNRGTTVEVSPATAPVPPKQNPVVLPGPAIAISAPELVTAYSSDPAVGDTKFKGKTVDVTGVVFSKKLDVTGEYFIAMEGGSEGFLGIRCYLHESNRFQFDEVETGQTLVVRGICDGVMTHVVLRSAAVIETKP